MPTACTISVSLRLQRGNATAAVELFGKAIKINGTVAEYHYNAALAWRALNRSDHVATHLEHAMTFAPTTRLPISIWAMCAASRADWQTRPRVMSARLRSARIAAVARFNLANVLSEQGRPDAAVTHIIRS